MAEPPLRFAAVGLDHRHIYHQVGRLLELGCECAGYWTDGDPQPLGGFLERFPALPRVFPTTRPWFATFATGPRLRCPRRTASR